MIDLLIRRELTRTTGTMNPELLEDIEDSCVRLYGADGEWRSRRIYHHMGRIVARVANRAFVGKELCESTATTRNWLGT